MKKKLPFLICLIVLIFAGCRTTTTTEKTSSENTSAFCSSEVTDTSSVTSFTEDVFAGVVRDSAKCFVEVADSSAYENVMTEHIVETIAADGSRTLTTDRVVRSSGIQTILTTSATATGYLQQFAHYESAMVDSNSVHYTADTSLAATSEVKKDTISFTRMSFWRIVFVCFATLSGCMVLIFAYHYIVYLINLKR